MTRLMATVLAFFLSLLLVPSASAEDLNSPPRPLPVKKTPFPKPLETTLKNGLQILLIQSHKVPHIAFRMAIRSGRAMDPALSEMTADLLLEGTSRQKGEEIAEAVESVGGALSVSVENDAVFIVGHFLNEHSDLAISLLRDVLENPVFPEEELVKLKKRTLSLLASKRSKPDFLAEERFLKSIYGDHPYSIASPSPESVEKVDREAVVRFHSTYFRPNNSILVVVGDFQPTVILSKLRKAFGTWKKAPIPSRAMQPPPLQAHRRIFLVDRPGSVQTALHLGSLTIPRSHPDFVPLRVAMQILGGSSSARLFVNLRERKSYTYGAYSSMTSFRDGGHYKADAEVRTEVTEGALKEFLKELAEMREATVTPSELSHAKAYLSGSFPLSLETALDICRLVLIQKLNGLPGDYWQSYRNRILGVTVADVQRAARKYITPNGLTIVAVGDGKKIEGILSQFGPLEVYDTSGKAVKSVGPGSTEKY
ncbi:MAG: insulinase family protein [Armatimonadetes bacterium]|nr:insulinase family protein [Armatimonadota bacterium]